DEVIEGPREVLVHRADRLGERRGEAPELAPILLRHVTDGLDEAGDEVALREEDVDGQAHREPPLHPVDALAAPLRARGPLVLAGAAEVADADGRDDPVERLLRAEALDEVEEGEPLVAIFVLAGPPARGVEDHALAGHPPVAVARAAEAAHASARRR